jgi:hypothetical protein
VLRRRLGRRGRSSGCRRYRRRDTGRGRIARQRSVRRREPRRGRKRVGRRSGVYGECVTTESCAALGDHTSTPGFCPGPDDIECCSVTPNVDDNPPVPAGWELMMQANVTSAMTTWAVDILNDPTMYPMFSTAMQTFGTLMVLARVEWHPPDFQNSVIHRGVTLYQPI